MAKFNIEVEIDSLDEDVSIDDEIREQVITGVRDVLLKKATNEAVKSVEKEINEKIELASETINQKVDEFVESVCQGKFETMMIPHKKSGWSSEIEMIPFSEYVGMRYEEFLNKKVLDSDGSTPRYSSDAKISINQYFINKYLEKELASKVSEMIKKAKEESENMVLKTLEFNLKEQLAAETIKQLNIPKLLENLQQKAIEFENNNTKGDK